MEFTPGSVHKATVTFSNPKTVGFDYKATLHMGTGWTEMASASFYLNAGQSKAVEFSVIMPATPGAYPVYFKVTHGGVLIGTFAAAEDVVIAAAAVTVKLKNPPGGANMWVLSLYDWTEAKSLSVTVYSVDGEAVFDIPPDWAFPLRFYISIIYYPNGSVTVLHSALSLSADLWWQYYVAEFIPDYGNYWYNVTTKKFEKR